MSTAVQGTVGAKKLLPPPSESIDLGYQLSAIGYWQLVEAQRRPELLMLRQIRRPWQG